MTGSGPNAGISKCGRHHITARTITSTVSDQHRRVEAARVNRHAEQRELAAAAEQQSGDQAAETDDQHSSVHIATRAAPAWRLRVTRNSDAPT